MKLFAPLAYWELGAEQHEACCNGCGTKGFIGWLVPDTIWLLNVTEACNIHDFMYAAGQTQADKEEADRVFLNNMIRIINAKGGLLRPLRLRRAKTYYQFVNQLGGPAFWDDKNETTEFKTA